MTSKVQLKLLWDYSQEEITVFLVPNCLFVLLRLCGVSIRKASLGHKVRIFLLTKLPGFCRPFFFIILQRNMLLFFSLAVSRWHWHYTFLLCFFVWLILRNECYDLRENLTEAAVVLLCSFCLTDTVCLHWHFFPNSQVGLGLMTPVLVKSWTGTGNEKISIFIIYIC